MTTVIEVVDRLARQAKPNYRAALARGDETLIRYDIITPLRVAHMLAQVFHETGGLQVVEENMNYRAARIVEVFGPGRHSAAVGRAEAERLAHKPEALAERVYGLGNPHKARELGNTTAGDGFRYRGRGVLQTTGRGSYAKLGREAGADFEGDPDLVASAQHALVAALLEWSHSDLNKYADRNDITTITRRINGGFNGFEDRKQWFAKIWPLVRDGVTIGRGRQRAVTRSRPSRTEAWELAKPDPKLRRLQRNLKDTGMATDLKATGHFDPATERALRKFQRLAGIRAHGIADEVTHAAMRQLLAATR